MPASRRSRTDWRKATSDEDVGDINMSDLVQALTNRINPSGTKEIVIRPYGDRQVEIIIPEVETEEVEQIKKQIQTAGQLEFRIVANRRDHDTIIAAAEDQAKRTRPFPEACLIWRRAGWLLGRGGRRETEGRRVDRHDPSRPENRPHGHFAVSDIGPKSSRSTIRNSGWTISWPKTLPAASRSLDVLLATDDGCNVTGDHLGVVSAGNDEYLNPCVNFRLRGVGATLFGELTTQQPPRHGCQPPFYRHLAIMLDERLLSFPRLITTISDSGRITGDFTTEEVDFLVGILRAGRLPATLKKEPISENQIGSMLGDDTIRKGKVVDRHLAGRGADLRRDLLPLRRARGLRRAVAEPDADHGPDGAAQRTAHPARPGGAGADHRYVGRCERADL